jgi:hypothetical protein
MIRLVARRPIAPAMPDDAPQPILTARELSYCVELLGRGVTLKDALDRIQAERPTLPFTPPEAA